MNPANLIGRANGVKHLHTSNGNTRDIINAILYADKFCAPYTANAAAALKGRNVEETCYNIWKFWKDHVRYVEDPDGVQYIKSPGYLMEAGQGDCKSYSVAAASILQNLRIPYKYRFISEDASKDLHHVYVVVPTSQGEIIIDCVLDQFNKQNAYAKKKDIAPQRSTAAGINGIGITQAEAVAQTWVAFEKRNADVMQGMKRNIAESISFDVAAKYPNGPILRSKVYKAFLDNLGALISSGSILIYADGKNFYPNFPTIIFPPIWDESAARLPNIEPSTGINLAEKRVTANAYYKQLEEAGLSNGTIRKICQLGVYNQYGISMEYMLYRCYNMVKYGQPWEPVPNLPYFNFANNTFVNQGTTAESLAMTVKIAMCFPAAGGITRPWGQPYQSVAGWLIQNGASDADFATWKSNYKPCPVNPINNQRITDAVCNDYEAAQPHITNNGAGLSEEYFAEDYALYQRWIGGNMPALPAIPGSVNPKKQKMGVSGTAKIGALEWIAAVVAAVISAVVTITLAVLKAKGQAEDASRFTTSTAPCPPPDFNMEYQTVDGCFIGTAPAECGSLKAKYCPDGSFTCLTPAQLKLPENQMGTPAGGFLNLSGNTWLLIAGAALLFMGFFASSSKSSNS